MELHRQENTVKYLKHLNIYKQNLRVVFSDKANPNYPIYSFQL